MPTRISNTSATSDTMYPTRIKSGCRVYVDLLINTPKDKTQQMSVLTREVILWLELQAGSSRIAHCRAIDLAEAIGSPKGCVNRALATLKARGYVTKITHNRIELRAYDPETRFTWLYPNWFTSEALTPAEKHIYLYILGYGWEAYQRYRVSITDIVTHCHIPCLGVAKRRKYVHEVIEKLYALELLTRKIRNPSLYHAAVYKINEGDVSKADLTKPYRPVGPTDTQNGNDAPPEVGTKHHPNRLPEARNSTTTKPPIADQSGTNGHHTAGPTDTPNGTNGHPEVGPTDTPLLDSPQKKEDSVGSRSTVETSEVQPWQRQVYKQLQKNHRHPRDLTEDNEEFLIDCCPPPGKDYAERLKNLREFLVEVQPLFDRPPALPVE